MLIDTDSAVMLQPRLGAVPLPARFLALAGVQGFLDQAGPAGFEGWITRLAAPSPPVRIHLLENGGLVGQLVADIWRPDVADNRGGDGRWGFSAPMPAALADGRTHQVELRLTDGTALLPGPVLVRFDPNVAFVPGTKPRRAVPVPARSSAPPALAGVDVLVSFVVVFYNMGREAVRTLTSLSRAYQRGADGIGYEVICIDNGSDPPLDSDWVAAFGPEFRLVRPDRPAASPVAAMNAAARTARGHHLAVMIDGAHVLSPGALREAAEAIAESPGVVVGLRQWFVGGDQRFLSHQAWTGAQEDILFDRIAWPQDGYQLFSIATPVWESPNHWVDAMGESNCLFVPAQLYAQIGGLDEAFDEPGAGYANLDLFVRATEASGGDVVALLGEATFHQFHDGTTTNVDNDAKDRKCRAYEVKYVRLRGKPWTPLKADMLRLRGRLQTRDALVNRQRPLSPAGLAVTGAVRAAELPLHFDEAAGDYLVSVYAEAGLHQRASWRGAALGVAPPDAFAMAAILHESRPSRILAVNVPPGLLAFLRDAVGLEGGDARFVVVGEGGLGGAGAELTDPAVARVVRRAVGVQTETLVLYHPGAGAPLEGLRACAAFVSLRSYLVCIGTAWGQPWLGYSDRWVKSALDAFLREAPFTVDRARTEHFVTSCPCGFLQRIGPILSGGDLVGVS